MYESAIASPSSLPLKVIYASTQLSVDSSLFNTDFLDNFIIISSCRSAGLHV